MKKILLSLAVIGLVSIVVTGATVAYFSDEKVIDNNVFAMGTVQIGEFYHEGFPFEIRNIMPGDTTGYQTGVLRIKYVGTLLADLYFGLEKQSGEDLKEILQHRIEGVEYDGVSWVHDKWITDWEDMDGGSDPFENWIKISEDMGENEWTNFKIHTRTKMPANDDGIDWNSYQGKESTVRVVVHAVQAGGTPSN